MARLHIESQTPTSIRLRGRDLVAFAGCNYLGLGAHPRVISALTDAARRLGLSTTASRETTGNSLSHEALEAELAAFVGQEAAILSAEGYTANFMAMQTLALTHRIALIDSHAHRSLRHAAIGAGMQVFDYEHLSAESAAWLAQQYADQGVAILTDSVFAANGAIAPLPELLAALPKHRATLVVDDCHGFGVLGNGGRGAVNHFYLNDPRIVITTTLAKGLGCYGGCVLGRKQFVQRVQDTAWVYRSSTPVPPAMAEACREALRVLSADTTLVDALRANIASMRQALFLLGLPLPPADVPIFTFALSPAPRQELIHMQLMDKGLFAPLIEYPGGPAERYFRVVVNARHTAAQIDSLARELARAMDATRNDMTPVPGSAVVEVKPGAAVATR